MNGKLPKLVKRQAYNDYSKFEKDIPAVLNRLINTKRGDLKQVSQETGIPYSTISRWHQQLGKNTRFNPLDRKWGQHSRIFTDAEEDAIADYIFENYIQKGSYFTDEDFVEIAMEAWREKYIPILNSTDPDEKKKFKPFSCSRGFIQDFKYHHMFSSKVFHIKRRANPDSDIETKFMNEMKELFNNVPHDRILNADETGWKLFPRGILTWGETGIDNVSRNGSINDKSQVTILATITAHNQKLPLLFVAQGQTERCEEGQLGDIGYHWKTHSSTGWVTDDVFSFYLHKLREFYDDDKEIHLVMDLYPSHITEKIKEDASALGIVFHFIPAGLTDYYQPLDRTIFGILKAKARKLFRVRQQGEADLSATKADACQDMIAAWEGISYIHISQAWELYTEEAETVPSTVHRIAHEQLIKHHIEEVKRIRKESIQKRIETRYGYKDNDGTYKGVSF